MGLCRVVREYPVLSILPYKETKYISDWTHHFCLIFYFVMPLYKEQTLLWQKKSFNWTWNLYNWDEWILFVINYDWLLEGSQNTSWLLSIQWSLTEMASLVQESMMGWVMACNSSRAIPQSSLSVLSRVSSASRIASSIFNWIHMNTQARGSGSYLFIKSSLNTSNFYSYFTVLSCNMSQLTSLKSLW